VGRIWCAWRDAKPFAITLPDLPGNARHEQTCPLFVTAVWDGEAGVYVSESDIIGLHIEAATVDEFEALVIAFVPELIGANHNAVAKNAGTPKRF